MNTDSVVIGILISQVAVSIAMAWLTHRNQRLERVLRWFALNVTLVEDKFNDGELPQELMDMVEDFNDQEG